MACIKRPVLAALKNGRQYSAAAATTKLLGQPNADSVMAKMSIIYNAGSRYENADNIGMSHAVRAAVALGNPKSITAFELPKVFELLGGSFSVSASREHLIYTYEGLHYQLDKALWAMCEVAGYCGLSKVMYNCDSIAPFLDLELSRYEQAPNVQVIEALHKAAFFRGGLANSLYIPRYAVPKATHAGINAYMAEFCVPANAKLVATNLGEDGNQIFQQTFVKRFASAGQKASNTSKYVGGESFIESSNKQVHAAIGFEGASMSSTDRAALTILRYALIGSEAPVKYGSKVGILANTAEASDVSAFNYSYADSGLFAVGVTADCKSAGKAIDGVLATLAKVKAGSGVTEADLKRAKAKVSVDIGEEQLDLHSVSLSRQVADPAKCLKAEEAALQAVTLQQVQAVAKKVLGSNPSLAAVGDLRSIPSVKNIKL